MLNYKQKSTKMLRKSVDKKYTGFLVLKITNFNSKKLQNMKMLKTSGLKTNKHVIFNTFEV
jgi:hypothetical protein